MVTQFLHHKVQLTLIYFRTEDVNLLEIGAVNQQRLGENEKAVKE